ncbi:MAG: tyrosine-type recombinase/integrase [Isosphaerales bacterium]
MARLIYGSGLRLHECLELRGKDLQWSQKAILVRPEKGRRDRMTLLPQQLVPAPRAQSENPSSGPLSSRPRSFDGERARVSLRSMPTSRFRPRPSSSCLAFSSRYASQSSRARRLPSSGLYSGLAGTFWS